MTTRSVFLVAGARPNFMKIAPLHRALMGRRGFAVSVVHTGQHYDANLSGVFFRDLGIPTPDITLGVGSGSHGAQTARVLERFEAVLVERAPDLVVVVGDVNSTPACALAAAKVDLGAGRRPRIAHVEAGLRSFDRTMPEEVNRVVTDTVSDLLFITEESARENLLREGIDPARIFFVGNVMIDTLLAEVERAVALRAWASFGVGERQYAVVTLHRPSNVDHEATLRDLMATLETLGRRLPIVFAVHPRTRERLVRWRLEPAAGAITLADPLGYLEFLSLMSRARLVLTDSGGIQEETTILGIPCLTVRANTERPVTVSHGTNVVVGTDRARILEAAEATLEGRVPGGRRPPLWDGKAAERIADTIEAMW